MPQVTNYERNLKIVDMYALGMTLEQVGDNFGLSCERVRQILHENGITRYHRGKNVDKEKQLFDLARDQKYFDLYGCDYKTYRKLKGTIDKDGKSPQHCYMQHMRNTKARGIAWGFNFYGWWAVWRDSGKWGKKGRTKSHYVMARIDASLPCSPDNVHIITRAESSRLGRLQRKTCNK